MKKFLVTASGIVLLNGCTGYLPLSDLINNSVTLKVLGTYESNDPYAMRSTLYLDDVFVSTPTKSVTGSSPALGDTNLTNYAINTLANQGLATKYYIDLAEIRLAVGQGKSSSQTISDYWSQFAIKRQLMCSDYNSTDTRILSNCSDANGIGRLAEFFNGGFTYPAVDVKRNLYNHLGIYFRRFVASGTGLFNGDGSYFAPTGITATESTTANALTAAFDNRTVYGFDVEGVLQNAYGENNSQGRMFPLERKNLSLDIQGNQEPYVLEVRVFIKNLMMVHLRQVTSNAAVANDPNNSALLYTAPSDWNVNHTITDTILSQNATKQGGAVLMTARTYQPSTVGAIRMAGTVGNGSDYFAVVPVDTVFPGSVATETTASTVNLPLAATNGQNTTIANLPPGVYDVYRTCDIKKCASTSKAGYCDVTTGSTATRAPDGFPETGVKCASGLTVTSGTTSTVSLGNCVSTNTTTNPCFIAGVN